MKAEKGRCLGVKFQESALKIWLKSYDLLEEYF
jgi:hypothetical protein